MVARAGAVLVLALLLAGCGERGAGGGLFARLGLGDRAARETGAGGEGAAADAAAGEAAGAPLSALQAPPPPTDARTAEEFDTTSPAARAAARADPEEPAGRFLGETVTSLGDPARPGFWMETPLVTEVMQGRVEDPQTGASVTVELRPSGGAPGSGSRLSLAAFRLLGIDLRSLPRLKVHAF